MTNAKRPELVQAIQHAARCCFYHPQDGWFVEPEALARLRNAISGTWNAEVEAGLCSESFDVPGGLPLMCVLRHGHGGMHEARNGAAWSKPHADARNDGSQLPPAIGPNELRACWCYRCCDAPEHGFNNPVLQRMILCPACGNKRCPRATDHRFACTGSNEPGQFGSNYGVPVLDARTPPTDSTDEEG